MSNPAEFYPVVNGSMTSADGKQFILHVEREDGSQAAIGFPHEQIPNIIECAAMQVNSGTDAGGHPIVTAFHTSGFQIGRGPEGQVVLNMLVGARAKIGFLITPEMQLELITMLLRSETKH